MARNKYLYANSKKVILELNGEILGWYDCISDVGRRLGNSTTTITNRIKSGRVVNGYLARWPNEEDDLNKIPNLSPPRLYGHTPKLKKGTCVDENGNLIEKETGKMRIRNVVKHEEKPEKEVVLDREKYLIIKYEVRNKVQCITPCPFMCSPKTMVGSPKCQSCYAFKGRDKKTHEVACKRKLYQ